MDCRDPRKEGSSAMDELERYWEETKARSIQQAQEVEILKAQIAQLRARFAPPPPMSIGELMAADRLRNQYQAPPPYSYVGVGANRWATHGEPSIGELWEADRIQNQYRAPVIQVQQAPPPQGRDSKTLLVKMKENLDKQREKLDAVNASFDKQKVHIEPPPIIQPQENLVELEHLDEFIECTTITAPEIPCPTCEPVEEFEEETIIDEDDEESSMAALTLEDDDDYQGALEFFNMLKAMSFPECAKEEQSFDIEICTPDEANEGQAVKYSPFEVDVDPFEFKPGWLLETPSFDIVLCIPEEEKKGQAMKYSHIEVAIDTFEFKPGWLFGTPSMRKRDPPDRKRRALTERSHPVVKKIKRMRWLEVLLSKPP